MNLSSATLLTALLIYSISGYAQNVKSGIGTINPQQTLHVAGATATPTNVGTTGIQLVQPTVRVDGLNSTNNTAHNAADGASSLKRVYANQSGDLVLVAGGLEQITNQQFGNAIIPNASVTSVLGAGIETPSLKAQTFTLTEPSIVNISASLNVQFTPLSTDGTAKVYGAYFRFSAAAGGISTTTNFGRNQKSYTNATTTGTTGDFMISPHADLVLPAGTYTVDLYGYIQGGSLNFTANFANSTNGGENLIITASPTQFQ